MSRACQKPFITAVHEVRAVVLGGMMEPSDEWGPKLPFCSPPALAPPVGSSLPREPLLNFSRATRWVRTRRGGHEELQRPALPKDQG